MGSTDRTVRVWDLLTADPAASARVLRDHEAWVAAVALSADARWLASGSRGQTVRV